HIRVRRFFVSIAAEASRPPPSANSLLIASLSLSLSPLNISSIISLRHRLPSSTAATSAHDCLCVLPRLASLGLFVGPFLFLPLRSEASFCFRLLLSPLKRLLYSFPIPC